MTTPTPESLRPTPGAVRAAKALQPYIVPYHENTIAFLIDRETGVRELLDALKDLVGLADFAMKEANRDGGEFNRDEELKAARAAIARCEGKDL